MCGKITGHDAETVLGPFSGETARDRKKELDCNVEFDSSQTWFDMSCYNPLNAYSFSLTQACEYRFKAPETNLEWVELNDLVHWFDQAATSFQRAGQSSYRVQNGHLFSGTTVPSLSDVSIDVSYCPESYCLSVTGESITRKEPGSEQVDEQGITWAFTDHDALMDFKLIMTNAISNDNSEKIFLTNNFVRCGCEPMCIDDQDPNDDIEAPSEAALPRDTRQCGRESKLGKN